MEHWIWSKNAATLTKLKFGTSPHINAAVTLVKKVVISNLKLKGMNWRGSMMG